MLSRKTGVLLHAVLLFLDIFCEILPWTMTTNIKTEPKDVSLVSSSMMLVNNPENASSYYPDMDRYTSVSRCSTSAGVDYHYHEPMAHSYGPFAYGTYYPTTYSSSVWSDHMTRSQRNCSCESVPPQQSFLHQILTGKGYRNDKLFVSIRPVIKQERDYYNYRTCYGYTMGYGFPVYHWSAMTQIQSLD